MCVNISSIKRIFWNQSHYFPDIPCMLSHFVHSWSYVHRGLGEKTHEDSILLGYDALSVGKWFPVFQASLVISCSRVSSVAEHCWHNRVIVGISCGQFGTVSLKVKLSTYIQELLMVGRRGCIQRALKGKMVSGRQRNWVTDASSRIREWCDWGGVWCDNLKQQITSSGMKWQLVFSLLEYDFLINWTSSDFTPLIQINK